MPGNQEIRRKECQKSFSIWTSLAPLSYIMSTSLAPHIVLIKCTLSEERGKLILYRKEDRGKLTLYKKEERGKWFHRTSFIAHSNFPWSSFHMKLRTEVNKWGPRKIIFITHHPSIVQCCKSYKCTNMVVFHIHRYKRTTNAYS